MEQQPIVRVYDKRHDLVIVWYGGHGIYTYRSEREIAFWTLSSYANKEPTLAEVLCEIANATSGEFPYWNDHTDNP